MKTKAVREMETLIYNLLLKKGHTNHTVNCTPSSYQVSTRMGSFETVTLSYDVDYLTPLDVVSRAHESLTKLKSF